MYIFFYHFIRSLCSFLRQMPFISNECLNQVIAQKASSIILNYIRGVIFLVLACQQNSSSPINCLIPLCFTTVPNMQKLKKGNLSMGAITTTRTPHLQFLQLLMSNFLYSTQYVASNLQKVH